MSAARSPATGRGRRRQRILLTGEIPSPTDPPSGCRFRTRCRRAQGLCAAADPAPPPGDLRHGAACHFPLAEPPTVTS
ncbi:oligopeptide/dipeptide ABC transporter ATP-binding protein [Streptomyces venetus]|uniref:oligopeptide/dipeptide ABC transporter ATP-binding protein n=1 Tax=Streptomyces venetus TaxID=1701086 RepID=UPI003CD0601D